MKPKVDQLGRENLLTNSRENLGGGTIRAEIKIGQGKISDEHSLTALSEGESPERAANIDEALEKLYKVPLKNQ